MQHITSHEHAHQGLSISYFAGEPYDGLAFMEYPNRHGWDFPSLKASFSGTKGIQKYLEESSFRESRALFQVLKSRLAKNELERHAKVIHLGDIVFNRIVHRRLDQLCVDPLLITLENREHKEAFEILSKLLRRGGDTQKPDLSMQEAIVEFQASVQDDSDLEGYMNQEGVLLLQKLAIITSWAIIGSGRRSKISTCLFAPDTEVEKVFQPFTQAGSRRSTFESSYQTESFKASTLKDRLIQIRKNAKDLSKQKTQHTSSAETERLIDQMEKKFLASQFAPWLSKSYVKEPHITTPSL